MLRLEAAEIEFRDSQALETVAVTACKANKRLGTDIENAGNGLKTQLNAMRKVRLTR